MISTDAFAKGLKNKQLSTEASILGWPALYAPEMFTLTSEWTGRQIALKKTYTETSDEGDIILWLYKPCDPSIDLQVDIFND